ncbi:hypothetical protein B0A50_02384 [Salinomyces thailandicus]|uniref:CCHC-type domain-containing protein n=1 Tax=Salinomyces thailandicus TaxID=706561 RepID=A0A4U0U6Q4_9PEZI|nr:hypothetical protein B0A50_02384 [Salinomyces thailandica]
MPGRGNGRSGRGGIGQNGGRNGLQNGGQGANNNNRTCRGCGGVGHVQMNCPNNTTHQNGGGNNGAVVLGFNGPAVGRNGNGNGFGLAAPNGNGNGFGFRAANTVALNQCQYHPGSTTHTTAECSANPANARGNHSAFQGRNGGSSHIATVNNGRANNNIGNSNTNNGSRIVTSNFWNTSILDKDGDTTMPLAPAIFQPAASAPIVPTAMPYCPGCNSTAHFEHNCPCAHESAFKRIHGLQYCWRCRHRGHTGDECANPAQVSCDRCHAAGHRTVECRNARQSSAGLFRYGARGAERFVWPVPGGGAGLAASRNEAPTPAAFYTGSNAFANGNVTSNVLSRLGPLSAEDQRLISEAYYRRDREAQTVVEQQCLAKCEHAMRTYHKEDYRHFINAHANEIQGQGWLTDNQWFNFSRYLNSGNLMLWRDPLALKAIYQKAKPKCNTCHCDGHFLDWRLRPMSVQQDVREVVDHDDWGVTVAFECRCCSRDDGYSYVSRPPYEMQS